MKVSDWKYLHPQSRAEAIEIADMVINELVNHRVIDPYLGEETLISLGEFYAKTKGSLVTERRFQDVPAETESGTQKICREWGFDWDGIDEYQNPVPGARIKKIRNPANGEVMEVES